MEVDMIMDYRALAEQLLDLQALLRLDPVNQQVSIFEKGDLERNVIQITVLFFKKWVCLQKNSCFY